MLKRIPLSTPTIQEITTWNTWTAKETKKKIDNHQSHVWQWPITNYTLNWRPNEQSGVRTCLSWSGYIVRAGLYKSGSKDLCSKPNAKTCTKLLTAPDYFELLCRGVVHPRLRVGVLGFEAGNVRILLGRQERGRGVDRAEVDGVLGPGQRLHGKMAWQLHTYSGLKESNNLKKPAHNLLYNTVTFNK